MQKVRIGTTFISLKKGNDGLLCDESFTDLYTAIYNTYGTVGINLTQSTNGNIIVNITDNEKCLLFIKTKMS